LGQTLFEENMTRGRLDFLALGLSQGVGWRQFHGVISLIVSTTAGILFHEAIIFFSSPALFTAISGSRFSLRAGD
jgi:hypothetical protein